MIFKLGEQNTSMTYNDVYRISRVRKSISLDIFGDCDHDHHLIFDNRRELNAFIEELAKASIKCWGV